MSSTDPNYESYSPAEPISKKTLPGGYYRTSAGSTDVEDAKIPEYSVSMDDTTTTDQEYMEKINENSKPISTRCMTYQERYTQNTNRLRLVFSWIRKLCVGHMPPETSAV